MSEIKYSNYSIFDVGTQTIVNTVNCYGIMGAGVALECKLRYPEMYEDYVQRCTQKQVRIGEPYLYKYPDIWILNFPTKKHWRYPSKLDWVRQGLGEFVDKYRGWGIESIAFPKLGCDKGRLNWDEVEPLMATYLKIVDIEVYICLNCYPEAVGLEKTMIDLINDPNNEIWDKKMGLRKNLGEKIWLNKPVNRFADLRKIPGMGEETYTKIFRQIYQQAKSKTGK